MKDVVITLGIELNVQVDDALAEQATKAIGEAAAAAFTAECAPAANVIARIKENGEVSQLWVKKIEVLAGPRGKDA